jgi:hypothetical protein
MPDRSAMRPGGSSAIICAPASRGCAAPACWGWAILALSRRLARRGRAHRRLHAGAAGGGALAAAGPRAPRWWTTPICRSPTAASMSPSWSTNSNSPSPTPCCASCGGCWRRRGGRSSSCPTGAACGRASIRPRSAMAGRFQQLSHRAARSWPVGQCAVRAAVRQAFWCAPRRLGAGRPAPVAGLCRGAHGGGDQGGLCSRRQAPAQASPSSAVRCAANRRPAGSVCGWRSRPSPCHRTAWSRRMEIESSAHRQPPGAGR